MTAGEPPEEGIWADVVAPAEADLPVDLTTQDAPTRSETEAGMTADVAAAIDDALAVAEDREAGPVRIDAGTAEQLAQPEVLGPRWDEPPPDLDEMTTSLPTVPPGTVAPTSRWEWLRSVWLAPRPPLLVAIAVLTALGAPTIISATSTILSTHPLPGSVSILLWALYSLPLIWLINQSDFFEREPAALLAGAFLWGGVVATGLAIRANVAVFSILTSAFGPDFTERWGSTLSGPITEEVVKGIGIILAILMTRRRIRSAVDGFVIGAMVGLGFQVVENFIYTGNLLNSTAPEGHSAAIAQTFLLRGVASGLWSHALYGGILGLGLGYFFTRTDRARAGVAVFSFVAAVALHALWNSPILDTDNGALGIVIKGAVSLGFLISLIRRAQRRESTIYTDYLRALHDPLLASEAEIDHLRTFTTRREVVKTAGRIGGAPAADAVRLLHRGQADLAVSLANGDVAGQHNAALTIQFARADMAILARKPRRSGYRAGTWALTLSPLALVIPGLGVIPGTAVAAYGTVRAVRERRRLAPSLAMSWVVLGVMFIVGLLVLSWARNWEAAPEAVQRWTELWP